MLSLREASFSRGGNITFKGTLKGNADFTTRLFEAELPLGNLPIYFTYSVSHPSCQNSIAWRSLQLSSTKGGPDNVVILTVIVTEMLKPLRSFRA